LGLTEQYNVDNLQNRTRGNDMLKAVDGNKDGMNRPSGSSAFYEIDLPSSPNILVVDDELSLLNLISSILLIKGLESEKASNLKDAFKALNEKAYDILFLDLGLPDGSGFKLLEKVIDISPEALVIIITGVHDLNTAVVSIRKGAFDYITKPFSVALFQERLNSVLSEWRERTFMRVYKSSLEKIVEEKAEELSKTVSHIDHVHDMTVFALGAALDLRDPETEDHCRRVSENSVLIGGKLGIRGEELKDLKWGAYLHDIGKIGVSENVLLKNGPLTEEEMNQVKKHSVLGYTMIKNIDFLTEAGKVVLYHHEKYDGSGYPFGIYGGNIPLHARIFAIADAFDAMAVDRPYRKAQPYDKIIHELEKCAGPHFDPEMVEVFKEVDGNKIRQVKTI